MRKSTRTRPADFDPMKIASAELGAAVKELDAQIASPPARRRPIPVITGGIKRRK